MNGALCVKRPHLFLCFIQQVLHCPILVHIHIELFLQNNCDFYDYNEATNCSGSDGGKEITQECHI